MVGVPGRSKACLTCRARRKGCDRQQPACGQCTRSGVPCGGYDRARIFINSRPENGDATAHNFAPAAYTPRRVTPSRGQGLARNQLVLPLTTLVTLERSLERTVLESKYLEFYWASLLPHGQPFTPRSARYSTTSWTSVIQDLCQRYDLVRLALLSNAVGLLGQVGGQPQMIRQGWCIYGRSLQLLAKSLAAHGRNGTGGDGLLAASGLLAAYELLQTAEGRRSWLPGPTWLRQASGEKAIILSNGPESYIEGHAHRLFVDSRLHLTYVDIHNRTRSAFSSPEWMSIPWCLHPKEPRDELVDVLIEIPALLQDLEHLLTRPSESPAAMTHLRHQLASRCWRSHHQLQTWSTTSGAGTVVFVEARLAVERPELSEPSSDDFAMAHLGMLYWATCNLLHHVMWYLARDGQTKLPGPIDPRQYCRKIVLLLPLFQSAGMGRFFLNIAGFPVAVAVAFLARQDSPDEISEERRMLATAFHGRHGSQLRNFLGTWPWRTDRETEIVVRR